MIFPFLIWLEFASIAYYWYGFQPEWTKNDQMDTWTSSEIGESTTYHYFSLFTGTVTKKSVVGPRLSQVMAQGIAKILPKVLFQSKARIGQKYDQKDTYFYSIGLCALFVTIFQRQKSSSNVN